MGGGISEDFIFLPRVVYKDIILSKAIWNFSISDFYFFYDIKSNIDLKNHILSWRKSFRIPIKFTIKELYNKLLIDSDNIFLFKLFLNTIRNKEKIVLEEFIFDKKNSPVINENKEAFTNELIINFLRNE